MFVVGRVVHDIVALEIHNLVEGIYDRGEPAISYR